MPTRTIRDSLLDSERYHACPIESRLLFVELLLCADDYGLVPASDVYLRRHTTVCEGRTAAQIASFLSPLIDQDLIRPYDTERGGRFAFIPRFDNRAQAMKPKWPIPPPHVDRGYISTAMEKSKRSGINSLKENDQVDTRSRPENQADNSDGDLSSADLWINSAHSPKLSTDGANNQRLAQLSPAEGEGEYSLKEPLSRTKAVPPCPQQKIVALWVRMLPGLRPPRSWGADRQRHLAARWRELFADEEFTDESSGLQWFEWFFGFIAKSPFLTGKVPGSNGKPPFMASLDWVVLPTNFAKIVDRNYHPKGMAV
jgi:hypothetical protein